MDEGEAERFAEQLAALEAGLGSAAVVTAGFGSELGRMRESLMFTGREVNVLSAGIGGGLRRAFDGLVFGGARLSDALRQVARSMVDTVYGIAMRPVQQALGGALAGGLSQMMGAALPFASGGAFSQGRVMPFAKGGVVGGPVAFPMRGGVGLMGEAGPEAILPLSRGADGRLGVQASGSASRPVQVVMNITTPDVQGFQRSRSQIAAEFGRALARGDRNG